MTRPAGRHAEVEAFYRAHHTRLEQKVAKRVSGPGRAVIEDVCQFAWTVLLRRPDIDLDHRGLAWMTLIAAREAWRTTSATAEPTAGRYALSGARDVLSEHGGVPGPTMEDRVIDREHHHQRRADLAAVKPAERQALGLKAAGYSYTEIAELTGASYTAVNRRLAEGRARLRRIPANEPPSRSEEGEGRVLRLAGCRRHAPAADHLPRPPPGGCDRHPVRPLRGARAR